MRQLLYELEEMLKGAANYLPLEVASFLGGFIEEVIAPIPSPFVMAAVGSAAFAQDKGFTVLVWLALIGSLGKTLGAWMIYVIADKLEDVLVGKYGYLLGVSHKEVEGVGKRFDGTWKDDWVLFILRALPIIPSSPVSVVCGIIKIHPRTYIVSTFFGNIFRNLIYIYFGYSGIAAYHSLLSGLGNMESLIQIVLFLSFFSFIGWIYYQRHKAK